MSEIKAILLVPAEGDPHGLLSEGPCGARPPLAYWYKRAWAPCTARAAHSHDKRRALVLAWDGKPVREGCDRADWLDVWKSAQDDYGIYANAYPDRDTWATVYALMDHPDDTHVTVDDLRRLCAELGTIVLLDADGKEIE